MLEPAAHHPCRLYVIPDREFCKRLTINMDAQDAQDNQDGTPLHEKPATAMIVCGFADAQDYRLAVSRNNPVHPVHPC